MSFPALPVADQTPALDLVVQDRIVAAAANSRAPSTQRAYDSAWRRFEQWCDRRGHQALPAHPAVIAAYLVDAADTFTGDGQRAYSPATMTKWLAAIGDRHRGAGASIDPAAHPTVRATLAGIRREYAAAGDRPRTPRAPLLTADIMTLVRTAREQSQTWFDAVIERRDSALLLMGFAGAFRRSELAALTAKDVTLHPVDGLHVHIRRSKTDQEGRGRVQALPRSEDPERCPPCAFVRWSQVVAAYDAGGRRAVVALLAGDTTHRIDEHCCAADTFTNGVDPQRTLFRAVCGRANLSARAMSGAAVHEMIRRRATRAGYPPQVVERLGAHSLRAGFVTQAFRNGADAHAIMRQTAHTTPAMVERYAREEVPLLGNAVTSLGL